MARKSSNESKPPEQATPQPKQPAPPPETAALPEGAQELLDLIAAARSGDASVLPRLREVLDAHPEVWAHAGNLARMTEQSWINLITGGDALIAESMMRQASQMKVDLEGPAPTALERLLVSQVVVCWLEMSSAEITLALPDLSLAEERHRVRHAEVAHRKYLTAIKALTTVRALQPKGVMPTEPLKIFGGKRA